MAESAFELESVDSTQCSSKVVHLTLGRLCLESSADPSVNAGTLNWLVACLFCLGFVSYID